jgi:hypothetical protein
MAFSKAGASRMARSFDFLIKKLKRYYPKIMGAVNRSHYLFPSDNGNILSLQGEIMSKSIKLSDWQDKMFAAKQEERRKRSHEFRMAKAQDRAQIIQSRPNRKTK